MNYLKKAEEVFIELFHENWMRKSEWNAFKNKASKICNYSVNDLATDLESGFPSVTIDEKLNEIKKSVKL